MFDSRTLPELLAVAVFAFVFWSILRRHVGDRLHAWLLGWICILVHFAVLLISGRPGVLQQSAYAVSGIALELAGLAFIFAAGGANFDPRLRFFARTALAATALYIVFVSFSVSSVNWYYAAAALLFATSLAALVVYRQKRASDKNRRRPFWGILLAVALGLLAWQRQPDYGPDAIFFVIYLLAALQYRKHFPKQTSGKVTTVIGFLAWACVFPIAAALEQFAPSIQVESSVWSIPKYIVAIGIVLTLLEGEIERTEHLALHDPLTGLPNRRLLEDRLVKAVERAERNEARVAVLLIDLDGFKLINDTYGHAIGDEVLRVVATRLQMRIRKADTIARVGGDEFLVVVSDLIHPQGAQILKGKLMADLNEPIMIGDTALRACASIGVAIYPEDGQAAQTLFENADAAMYEQKRRTAGVPTEAPAGH
jgi:diguanylate cyclase (GGDEF)-like protein